MSFIHRPDRSKKVETRCSQNLRKRLEKIAFIKEAQLSDVVREALKTYVDNVEDKLKAA